MTKSIVVLYVIELFTHLKHFKSNQPTFSSKPKEFMSAGIQACTRITTNNTVFNVKYQTLFDDKAFNLIIIVANCNVEASI